MALALALALVAMVDVDRVFAADPSTGAAQLKARLKALADQLDALLKEDRNQAPIAARRLNVQPQSLESAAEAAPQLLSPEEQKALALDRLDRHMKEERQRQLDDLLLLRAQQLQ